MFEEEITTSLLFWSADGRLRTGNNLTCSEIDLVPTVLDLFGIYDATLPIQGTSILRSNHMNVSYSTSFFQDVSQALVMGDQKYIFYPTSGKLLHFDLSADPDEHSSIDFKDETDSARIAILERLKAYKAYQKSLFPAL
jgi:arylsulfatase A-like enzyme